MAHTIMSTTSTLSVAPAARRIPLWLKLAYTAFMAVLVPVYLRDAMARIMIWRLGADLYHRRASQS
jgi:hypothetical protein